MWICDKDEHCIDCPKNYPKEKCEHWIEVAEVKHGWWLYEGKRGRFPVCRCSVCGNEENADWAVLGGNVNYCPNCGAKMDEVGE